MKLYFAKQNFTQLIVYETKIRTFITEIAYQYTYTVPKTKNFLAVLQLQYFRFTKYKGAIPQTVCPDRRS